MPSGIAGVLVVLQLGTLTAVQPSIAKESLGPLFVGVFKDLANQLLRYVGGRLVLPGCNTVKAS